MDAQIHVVIDNGTGFMKGGFSGEETPKCTFPTVIGINKGDNSTEIGDNTIGKTFSMTKSPIENGIITNTDDMGLIWEYIIKKKLNRSPEDHNVILTDVPLNDKKKREEMAQVMFETLKVPGLYISMTSVMSLYSTGKTVGIVVDSGESITNFVPIFEGYAFPDAISKINIGGKSINKYLEALLKDKDNYSEIKKNLSINDLKEKFCYVSYDYQNELSDVAEDRNGGGKIKLQSGEEILVGVPIYKCTEALFQPDLIDKSIKDGIHVECNNSISKTEIEIRKDFYHNIVMAGGNTLFRGLPDRFTKEIQNLTLSASSDNVKVFALPERKYASWIGASILSSLSNFQCMWVTKAEYEEENKDYKDLIHKRFI